MSQTLANGARARLKVAESTVARYLVVGHETLQDQALIAAVKQVAGSEAGAEFVILVPATPVEEHLTWNEGKSQAVAEHRLELAQARLRGSAVTIAGGRVGDSNPFVAISEELRDRPDYHGIIVSTLPLGLSRWLRADLITRLRRHVAIPVTHVTASRPASSQRRATA